MLTDWFTILAQIINFLILLALLKWLLFDRIVRAMDQREEKIAARLDEADQRREEAEDRARELDQQRRELDARRDEILQSAREDAERRRKEWLDEARQEVDQAREQWLRELREQQQELIEAFREQAGEAILQGTRQALEDLADDELQERAVARFLHVLQDLEDDARSRLQQMVEQPDSELVVHSARELSQQARDEIHRVLQETLHDGVSSSFDVAPGLIAGLEIRSRGEAIGWNLQSYLDGLDESLEAALRDQAQTP